MDNDGYRTLSGECKICGEPFSFQHRTGRYQRICSDKCREVSRLDGLARRPVLTCQVDGCGKKSRGGRQPICEMHYHRRIRTGVLEKAEPLNRWLNKADGYYMHVSMEHPLAGKNGQVREHRAVAYDERGPGPHPCYWCGNELDWPDICVDHLNGVRSDNRPPNLVVSCNGCNGSRGKLFAFIAKVLPERRDEVRSMIDEAFRNLRLPASSSAI